MLTTLSTATLRPLALSTLATLTLAAVPALATTTTYTTQASFMAAVQPNAYTETFSGAAGTATSYSFSSKGYGYTVTASPAQGMADDVYRSGSFIGNYYSNTSLTITFTGTRPTAIGGNFYITDANDSFAAMAPVTIGLSDGTVTTFTPASASTYRGFTSTAAITSLTLAAPGDNVFNTVDNLTVGTAASVAAVPEPATWASMAVSIFTLIVLARRSRAS